MCKSMKGCGCMGSKILWTLVIIGAVNWGLVGAFDLDLVMVLFGSVAWLQNLIYILVGVAGLALLFGGCRCARCKADGHGACCGGGCGSKKDAAMPMDEDMSEEA